MFIQFAPRISGLTRRSILSLVVALVLIFAAMRGSAQEASFDHSGWDGVLKANVVSADGGAATRVDYVGMAKAQPALDAYLAGIAELSRAEFDALPLNEQLALLINLYNAATVALIVEQPADIESIRDIGSFFTSAWEMARVDLFGELVTLDHIEHELIRGSGRYQEPRIHFAVNCAAIGCPALRAEAYTGARLEQQLDDATRRFLADRSRNTFDGRRLRLSSIFKWYREDFESGWGGSDSLGQFAARYAAELGLSEAQARTLAAGEMGIRFLSYDWSLNGL